MKTKLSKLLFMIVFAMSVFALSPASQAACRWVPGHYNGNVWVPGHRICGVGPIVNAGCAWVPGHWAGGYWRPGHRVCR